MSSESLKDRLEDFYIPPRPEILDKLEEASHDMALVAKVIETEPMLVAKVLQLINSPYYGLQKKITSLKHACLMFGYEQIKTLVKCELLKKAFSKGDQAELERFWTLAKQTAFCAKQISIKLDICKPDECFTIGLFHNIGALIFLDKIPDYFKVVSGSNALVKSGNVSLTKFEDEKFGINHAILSFHLAKMWGFVDKISDIFKTHHDEDRIFFKDHTNKEACDLLAVLKLADHFASNYVQPKRIDANYEWVKTKHYILDYVGLSEPDYDDLKDEINEIMDEAAS